MTFYNITPETTTNKTPEMLLADYLAKANMHETYCVNNVKHFTTFVFYGRGSRLKTEHETIDEAVASARNRRSNIPSLRPIGIYAVSSDGFSAHICNI